ncbi:GAF domain-containing protein [Rhizobiaceae bacterium]|nr:GAF domain-containing protein [Rhizobiaceae bacterium]
MSDTTWETPNYEVDLTSCDREPIHQLGAVQSFGFLIAVSTDWIVSRVSQNIGEFLDTTPEDMVGAHLHDVLDEDALHALRGLTQGLRGTDAIERGASMNIGASCGPVDVAMYLSDSLIVIEAEPAEEKLLNAMGLVRTLTGRLQGTSDLDGLLKEAARQMRAIVGFDRVMIYRFEADDTGEVVAEAASSTMEPFLGLRYPASDIPKQARALYLRSMLRIIWDTTEFGVPIVPQVGPSGERLDLSMSVLRSVSPIHLEYLTNMGVRASMSVSIIVDGKLWGLFACHHLEPRRISLERRTAAELYCQMASWLIESRARDENVAYEERSRILHNRLMATVANEGSTMGAILGHAGEIAELVESDGIGIWIDGQMELHGSTPTADEFKALIRHISTAPAGRAFATDELGANYPNARDYAERAAGVLAIPISRQPRDYLVFFRREVARSVKWAGDPTKTATPGPNGQRLSPRKSFKAWHEVVSGKSAAWSATDIRIAEALRATLLEVILRMTDETDRERRASQDRQELLIAELNHRVRNILGLIRGLVTQTTAATTNVEDFASVIGGRIQALARAHDQVTTNNWGPASLRELVRSEALAYLNDQKDRMRIEGPDVLLDPVAFSTVALVIHEMMTNAAKYGSLTDHRGHVDIVWERDDMERLVINWRERGGPAVRAPTRRGFGTTIIDRSIPFELKGEAEVRYEVTGVVGRFVLPAEFVTDGATPQLDKPDEERGPVEARPLSGHVLLVEDNMLIALDAEDMLKELGAEKVDAVASVREAMRAIEETEITFALLDVNLGNETSVPLALELAKRDIPFIFATGYGERVPRPSEIENAPMLTKPYTIDTARKVLAQLGSMKSEDQAEPSPGR